MAPPFFDQTHKHSFLSCKLSNLQQDTAGTSAECTAKVDEPGQHVLLSVMCKYGPGASFFWLNIFVPRIVANSTSAPDSLQSEFEVINI